MTRVVSDILQLRVRATQEMPNRARRHSRISVVRRIQDAGGARFHVQRRGTCCTCGGLMRATFGRFTLSLASKLLSLAGCNGVGGDWKSLTGVGIIFSLIGAVTCSLGACNGVDDRSDRENL